jgi:hypothetical protein
MSGYAMDRLWKSNPTVASIVYDQARTLFDALVPPDLDDEKRKSIWNASRKKWSRLSSEIDHHFCINIKPVDLKHFADSIYAEVMKLPSNHSLNPITTRTSLIQQFPGYAATINTLHPQPVTGTVDNDALDRLLAGINAINQSIQSLQSRYTELDDKIVALSTSKSNTGKYIIISPAFHLVYQLTMFVDMFVFVC